MPLRVLCGSETFLMGISGVPIVFSLEFRGSETFSREYFVGRKEANFMIQRFSIVG